jgi:hypothetical protein
MKIKAPTEKREVIMTYEYTPHEQAEVLAFATRLAVLRREQRLSHKLGRYTSEYNVIAVDIESAIERAERGLDIATRNVPQSAYEKHIQKLIDARERRVRDTQIQPPAIRF